MALLVHLMGSWLSGRSPVSACSGLTGCCWKTVQSRSDLWGCRQHHPACWNGLCMDLNQDVHQQLSSNAMT